MKTSETAGNKKFNSFTHLHLVQIFRQVPLQILEMCAHFCFWILLISLLRLSYADPCEGPWRIHELVHEAWALAAKLDLGQNLVDSANQVAEVTWGP